MSSKLSNLNTLQLGILAFAGAASLDALSSIVVSAGLLAIPFVTRAVALGVVIGLLEFCVVAIALIPRVKSLSTDLSSDLVSGRGALLITLLTLILIIGGAELIAFGAVLPGSMEIVGAVVGALVYFIKFRSSLPVSRNELLTSVLTLVAMVFLAIAGFSGAPNVLTTHLGVVSIALMMVAVAALARSYGASDKVVAALLTVAAIVFAVSLLVGNGVGIWLSSRAFRFGGAVLAGAVLGILSGISGVIAGVVLVIEGLRKVGNLMKGS